MLTPESFVGGGHDWPVVLHDTPVRTDAWRQLHHAAQAVVEVGKSWGDPKDDDSHSAFHWDEDIDRFVNLGGELSATLRFFEGIIEIGRHDEQEGAWLALDGVTKEQAIVWVRSTAERLGGTMSQASKPAPDLPDHAVGHGESFGLDGSNLEGQEAVESLYDLAGRLLAELCAVLADRYGADQDEAIPRIWPHHFDAASLFVVERGSDNSMTKSIGVGLTPPDSIDGSGYWYVSPWTRTDGAPNTIPDLPYGRWYERDGAPPMAYLPLDDLVPIAIDQRGPHLAAFIAAAFNASVEMLNT